MNTMISIAFAVISTALIGACTGGATNTGINVPFTTIAQSSSSASVSVSEGQLARNQSEFNTLWARAYTHVLPLPQAPGIDFNDVQVIAYFLASRPNGCYSVSIMRVTRYEDRLLVIYKEGVPGPTNTCTQGFVYPAHLISVPKSQLPVVFAAE